MTKQRSLRIANHFDRFIEERVGSEHYETAEDVVEAGLSLLEREEIEMTGMIRAFDRDAGAPMTLEELRAVIQAGEESGEPQEVDFEELFREVCAEAEKQR